MSKLKPWLPIILMALILSSWAGSVVVSPGPETAPPLSSGYYASRSVCGASPSMLASLIERMPAIGPPLGLFDGPERLIKARLPSIFSDAPKGDITAIERIIVKASQWFL